MKQCCTCKEWKPITEFTKNRSNADGLQFQCKLCQRESNKRYYYSEKGQRQQKAYEHSERGKIARRRAIKKYKQSKKGKAQRRKEDARRRNKYPRKTKARLAVNHAVENGTLPHVSTHKCKHCGSTAEQYHHHKGYNKMHWLDVIPLCIGCHRIADAA